MPTAYIIETSTPTPAHSSRKKSVTGTVSLQVCEPGQAAVISLVSQLAHMLLHQALLSADTVPV